MDTLLGILAVTFWVWLGYRLVCLALWIVKPILVPVCYVIGYILGLLIRSGPALWKFFRWSIKEIWSGIRWLFGRLASVIDRHFKSMPWKGTHADMFKFDDGPVRIFPELILDGTVEIR